MANCARESNGSLATCRKKYDMNGWPLHKKYRSHFEIIALVLEAVKSGCTKNFPIMKYASVNCTQLKKYLKSLSEMDFIVEETNDGGVSYRATERGLEFLSQYYVLLGMLLAKTSDKTAFQPNKSTVSPILQRKL
jgi:predicted transcriptional regulator